SWRPPLSSGPLSPHALDFLRNALLVGAPARVDAERRALENRFDPPDLALFDLEELAKLPGPVDPVMVEEGEGEDDASLAIHRDAPPVADARHDPLQRHLELPLAAHSA